MLEVKNLHISIIRGGSEKYLIKDLSFKIPEGTILLVTGEPGTGKSLLCYILAGIYLPGVKVTGEIRWRGKLISGEDFNPEIALTLENPYAQISGVKQTVFDELAFTLEMRGFEPEKIRERVKDVLKIFKIENLAYRDPLTLSGGETQRLAIASSFISEPKLWILDRPLTELDEGSRDFMVSLIYNFAKKLGITFIIAGDEIYFSNIANFELNLNNSSRELTLITKNPFSDKYVDFPVDINLKSRSIEILRYGKAEGPEFLQIKGLSFRYPGQSNLIFSNFNLSASLGEILIVKGPNGSGKTTLAKIIAGILKPDSGEIIIGDEIMNRRSIYEFSKYVAYAFQNPDNEIFCKTVFDEIAFGPRVRNHPRDKIDERVLKIIENLGLEGKEKLHPLELTRAEKKRLSIAIAFALDTPIIILDEPYQYQSAYFVKKISKAIEEVAFNENKMVIIITHISF